MYIHCAYIICTGAMKTEAEKGRSLNFRHLAINQCCYSQILYLSTSHMTRYFCECTWRSLNTKWQMLPIKQKGFCLWWLQNWSSPTLSLLTCLHADLLSLIADARQVLQSYQETSALSGMRSRRSIRRFAAFTLPSSILWVALRRWWVQKPMVKYLRSGDYGYMESFLSSSADQH